MRKPNPTELVYWTGWHWKKSLRIGKRPVIHMRHGYDTPACDPKRQLDMKTEGVGLQWYDVTCRKCQKELRKHQPKGPRKWKRFVFECSERGAQYMRDVEAKAMADIAKYGMPDNSPADAIFSAPLVPLRHFMEID